MRHKHALIINSIVHEASLIIPPNISLHFRVKIAGFRKLQTDNFIMADKSGVSPKPDRAQEFLRFLEYTVPNDEWQKKAGPIITECKFIASYNWLDRVRATIVVPGE